MVDFSQVLGSILQSGTQRDQVKNVLQAGELNAIKAELERVKQFEQTNAPFNLGSQRRPLEAAVQGADNPAIPPDLPFGVAPGGGRSKTLTKEQNQLLDFFASVKKPSGSFVTPEQEAASRQTLLDAFNPAKIFSEDPKGLNITENIKAGAREVFQAPGAIAESLGNINTSGISEAILSQFDTREQSTKEAANKAARDKLKTEGTAKAQTQALKDAEAKFSGAKSSPTIDVLNGLGGGVPADAAEPDIAEKSLLNAFFTNDLTADQTDTISALLAGLAGGAVNAGEDASIGQLLLQTGLGGLTGIAESKSAKAKGILAGKKEARAQAAEDRAAKKDARGLFKELDNGDIGFIKNIDGKQVFEPIEGLGTREGSSFTEERKILDILEQSGRLPDVLGGLLNEDQLTNIMSEVQLQFPELQPAALAEKVKTRRDALLMQQLQLNPVLRTEALDLINSLQGR